MTISKEERAELRADIRANCYPDVSGEITSLLDLPPRVFVFRDRWVSQSVELTDKQAKEHNAAWLPIPALPEGGVK